MQHARMPVVRGIGPENIDLLTHRMGKGRRALTL